MITRAGCLLSGLALAWFTSAGASSGQEKGASGIAIDKVKRTVTIPCAVAPRKLPNLKEIYPIEVVATFPAPRGQKAHETVLTFEVKPSEVHKALEALGLKAGKPAVGEGQVARGPEVQLFLEVPVADGWKRFSIEETMVDKKTGQILPPLKWHFTGSAFKNPDPEKDDKVYGADLSGTLITIFPVTDDTVFQSGLSSKDEASWRLETNPKVMPKEGTAVKLVIQVP
jgi:hypothetical protein